MTDLSDEKRDFFVSFNQVDRPWATWIAWVLERAGYSVFFQDWDFRGSFLEQMHQASQRTGHTLVVLSDHYLRSEYARSEAWAALARDPVGREDRVVTIKVGPTTGNLGLFSHFAYLDLTTSAEADAECLLLERARKAVEPDYRAKPATRPGFPGGPSRQVPERPNFPPVERRPVARRRKDADATPPRESSTADKAGSKPTSVTAKHGSIAAGRDMTGNTITISGPPPPADTPRRRQAGPGKPRRSGRGEKS